MLSFIATHLLLPGLVAALVGPAFAVIFAVPRAILPYIAAGAFICKSSRELLLSLNFSAVSSAFIACALISLIFIYVAPKLQIPRPVLLPPCVIGLIPGLDAYSALLALLQVVEAQSPDLIHQNIITLFACSMRVVAVMLAIALGIAIPPLFFYRYRYHHF